MRTLLNRPKVWDALQYPGYAIILPVIGYISLAKEYPTPLIIAIQVINTFLGRMFVESIWGEPATFCSTSYIYIIVLSVAMMYVAYLFPVFPGMILTSVLSFLVGNLITWHELRRSRSIHT